MPSGAIKTAAFDQSHAALPEEVCHEGPPFRVAGPWCPIDALPVDVISDAQPSSGASLARDYLDLGRPFVLQGGVAATASGLSCVPSGTVLGSTSVGCATPRRPLSVASLVAECGNVNVSVGAVPLAEAYSRQGTRMPLRDFIERQMRGAGPAASPQYVFDTALLLRPNSSASSAGNGGGGLRSHAAPLHAALIAGLAGGMPPAREQLAVGPALSGAPPHFHRAAVNVLLAGVKLWAVWTPAAAAFVDGTALDFWRATSGRGAGGRRHTICSSKARGRRSTCPRTGGTRRCACLTRWPWRWSKGGA